MQRIELEVTKRDTARNPKALRREGRVPGICYGVGGEPVAVEFDEHEFSRLGLGSSGAHILRFKSAETALQGTIALVRDLQIHPISEKPLHVDFLRIDTSKPVEALVALSYVGKAKGVVEGGIVQPLRRELNVRALPDRLPESIEVDVTELDVHDSIHIEDVTLPEGVEALFTENFTLVTVVPPTVEEAPTAAEGEEGLEAEAGEAAAEGGDEGEKSDGDGE
jgi:large subunit ribosomal protein L25